MSQRSHIASSGSTAIWRVLGGVAACPRSDSVQLVPERLRRERRHRQFQRDQVEWLVVGEPLALIGQHLLGDHDDAEAELDAHHRARASTSSMWVSVERFGCVYQSPSNSRTNARPSPRCSSDTSNCRPPCK